MISQNYRGWKGPLGWFQCWAASRREDGWKRQPDTHILVGVALFKGRTKTIGNSFWIKPSFWVWMQVRGFHWNGSGKKCSLCPAKHTVLPRKKLFVSRRRVKGSQMVALQNCLCMDGTGLRVYIQGCWKSPLTFPFFASDLWIGLFYKIYFLEECLWLYLSTMTYHLRCETQWKLKKPLFYGNLLIQKRKFGLRFQKQQ